jgi:hypothetical protein
MSSDLIPILGVILSNSEEITPIGEAFDGAIGL